MINCYDGDHELAADALPVPGFGECCSACVQRCPCGMTWPKRTVAQAPEQLVMCCAGCARRASDEVIARCSVPA